MVSKGCAYQVGTDEELKKFKFGGMPEGTIEIDDEKIVLFKKSKVVSLAFGRIGSAVEGKGTQDFVIPASYIVSREPSNNDFEFNFRLQDGRLAHIRILGFSRTDAIAAMESFASQIKA